MYVDNDGKVGIGTIYPEAKLHVYGAGISAKYEGSNESFIILRDNDEPVNNKVGFIGKSGGVYALQLGGMPDTENLGDRNVMLRLWHNKNVTMGNSGGNVGIGTMSPTEKLYVTGNIYATGTITQGSSRELKEDINNLTFDEAVETLKQLQPTKYYYKEDNLDEHLGFIAEDVPELVASKDRKGLSPMDIVAVLTKVVQEQEKRITVLEKHLAELERR